jgi:hypothetical protein
VVKSTAATKVKEKSAADTRFVGLNKNLCNFPLARDRRVAMKWFRLNDDEVYAADLPGDDRIRLIVPVDAPRRFQRCPAGFDMNVIGVLSATATFQQRRDVKLPTRRDLLTTLGLRRLISI